MRAKFINEVNQFQRGIDPKDAMGIGDPASRLAQSLKALCDEMGYEFRFNKRGTPRMVVPVNYSIDSADTWNATQHWRNGVVTEIHYTLTWMPDRQEDGQISLRKVFCGYDKDVWMNENPDPKYYQPIKQGLMGRFHSFIEIIQPLKTSIKNELKKSI